MSKGGAEFASEPNIDRDSIFNGMEKRKREKKKKRWERRRNSSMASSSIISLKGQDFVGGIGKSSELQMHWTAGYFPLPWPAKESSFKTHLPVNILAWLWVISPVWMRPSRAWRCTCTTPWDRLGHFRLSFLTLAPPLKLIVIMVRAVGRGYFLKGLFFHLLVLVCII